MDRITRLLPLGRQRVLVFECLGGNSPIAPAYFECLDDTDIFEVFHAFVARTSQLCAGDTYPLTISLLAAARLLTGDLAAADAILDHLPPEDFKLDHGAGICVVAPLRVLCAALPLPADLKPTDRWLAGLPEPTALRAWLAGHRDKLRWLEAQGVYLPRPNDQAQLAQPAAGRVAHVRYIMAHGRDLWHANSDLIFADGAPTIVIKNPWSADQAEANAPLDRRFLHAIDWDDAEYVYDCPIEDPRPFSYRRSIWQRLFG
jgi:hypothetical protein